MEFATRGSVLVGLNSYLEGHCTPEQLAQLRAGFPESMRQDMARVKHAEWYPRDHFIQFNKAIASLHEGDQPGTHEALRDAGQHICEIATNTFMKLMLRMLTPEMFAKKFPDFWDRDNRGGRCRVDTGELKQQRMLAWVEDVEGFTHVGPVACGYVGFALQAIVRREVKITLDGWSLENPAPESVCLHCSW